MKKKLVILGGGESGVGAAILAQNQGYEVFLSDWGKIDAHFKQELESHQIEFEDEKHSLNKMQNTSLVIKSPGIPETANIIQAVRNEKIELISEVEFASRYAEAPIIAITGSNGKTTTTALIHHIFQKAGRKAALCGNIGKSFARCVNEGSYEFYIVEVSSFQLDDIKTFKPKVAVLLNVTSDHLERYDHQFANYLETKFRVTAFQDSTDLLVYGADDAEIQTYMQNHPINATAIPFGLESNITEGGYTIDNHFIINLKKKSSKCQSETYPFGATTTRITLWLQVL